MRPLAANSASGVDLIPGDVRVAFTGNFSELRNTVPIPERPGRARTIMSLEPSELGTLRVGDRISANAEFQVTINCFEPSERCFGKPYNFSPIIEWRLELAPGVESEAGKAVPLSDWSRAKCSHDPPDRNHHCVYLTRRASMLVSSMPPCGPSSCHVNLVLRAYHRDARPGDELAIGGDDDDGSFRGDKGRINAVLYRPGVQLPGATTTTTGELRGKLPVGPDDPPREPIYRVELNGLKAGEQITVDAKTIADIAHLPYSALVQSEIVVSTDPNREGLEGIRNFISLEGRIAESNGFNCTQGASAFRTPCEVRKVAAFHVNKDVVSNSGQPRPVYVLLLTGLGYHYGGRYHSGDTGNVGEGYMTVERFTADRRL